MSSKSPKFKNEKFKSIRLKLSGVPNAIEGTENLFKEVGEKTGALIQWETGTFSSTFKRDPVIRLCGHPDAVKTAREMILQSLEIQCNKIVLKMDITHEEHPSLIGRKGCLIKKVMDATSTHIHFPDKNIVSIKEKSNQVSITGEPLNVEKARIMLRTLIPFQVIFDVDKSAFHFVNSTSPYWKELDQKLGLAVHFIQRKTAMSCVIRCTQGHFRTLRPQILTLIEVLSGRKGSEIPPVKVMMDIMPQHQNFVKGPKRTNIQSISKRTGAKIVLPTVTFDNIGLSTVEITGNLDCVYMAWQEIMSSLPTSVFFDVNEMRDIKNDYADFLSDCPISIYSRPKSSSHTKGVTIKGPERFSKQILQYRQRVLNLPGLRFSPDCHSVNKALSFQSNLLEDQASPNFENLALFSSIALSNVQLESLTNALNAADRCYFSDVHPPSHPSPFDSKVRPLSHHPCAFPPPPKPLHGFAGQSSFSFNKFEESTLNNNNEAASKETVDGVEAVSPNRSSCSTSSDDPISLPDSPIFKPKSNEIFEKKLGAYQAIHRKLGSTQVPSNLWAGYGFSQSMPAQTVTSDASSYSSSNSLESNSCYSSDDAWDKIILADYIDDKIWSNRDCNIFSQSNVFDFKRHTLDATHLQTEDQLPRLLYQEGLYSCLDTFLKEEIDYKAFILLNDEDLISLGFSYHSRMKIICLIKELQDAEMISKTFDAAPGAGRKSVAA